MVPAFLQTMSRHCVTIRINVLQQRQYPPSISHSVSTPQSKSRANYNKLDCQAQAKHTANCGLLYDAFTEVANTCKWSADHRASCIALHSNIEKVSVNLKGLDPLSNRQFIETLQILNISFSDYTKKEKPSLIYRHWYRHTPRHNPKVQYAFKISMTHWILQFALRIAVRSVLHRCASLDIHCWKLLSSLNLELSFQE